MVIIQNFLFPCSSSLLLQMVCSYFCVYRFEVAPMMTTILSDPGQEACRKSLLKKMFGSLSNIPLVDDAPCLSFRSHSQIATPFGTDSLVQDFCFPVRKSGFLICQLSSYRVSPKTRPNRKISHSMIFQDAHNPKQALMHLWSKNYYKTQAYVQGNTVGLVLYYEHPEKSCQGLIFLVGFIFKKTRQT